MIVRRFFTCLALLAVPALAQSTTPPDAAKLALSRAIAGRLMPPGIYQRLMSGPMNQMMSGMSRQMTAMPLAPLLKSAGLPEEHAAALGEATLKQVLDIVDPAYQQRMDAMMPILLSELGKVLTGFEPQLRDAMALAYANHFTTGQLDDIEHFLETPSGQAFAAQNALIGSDPEVIRKTQQLIPLLVARMPEVVKQTAAATANLPKPKTYQTLSDAERAKLAKLLGLSPEKRAAPTS